MNPLESQLEYPFGDALPELGSVKQVVPGVFWLRMALPFALDHINLWLLEDEVRTNTGIQRGWTIIDCGLGTEPTRQAWESIFANHLRGLPVLRVIATHYHPDHLGLSDWLCQRWNAPLWMSAADFGMGRLMSAGLPGADGFAVLSHYERHGVTDPAILDKLRGRSSHYPSLVPAVPHSYHRIHAGMQIAIGKHKWKVYVGHGHSPEHVSLHCAKLGLLISGDMLLPRISTNISVNAVEPESNPVQLFLDSLARYRELPASTLVLPSHGKPFRGMHTRIAQLNQHHRERLAEVLEACTSAPRSAADIVPIMFRRALDAHQLTFALGEALAHLHKLWFDGLLRRQTDDDGIIRFAALTQ